MRSPSAERIAAVIKAALAAGLKAGEFDVKAAPDGRLEVVTHPMVIMDGGGGGGGAEDGDQVAGWKGAIDKWRQSG